MPGRGGGRAARVGVVGGTFDPIHLGHVEAGEAARDELGLDEVLFMPAGSPAFKQGRRIAAASDRLAMTRIAVRGLPACRASSLEVDRAGVTFTADTLEELATAYAAGTELFFVMGADSLETLPLWRRAADIVRLATIVVARREGHDVACALERLRKSGLDARVRVLERAVPSVSSTLVRAYARAGRDVEPFVGAEVARYIREHGLYSGVKREA